MFALRDSPVYFEVISGVFVGQKSIHFACFMYALPEMKRHWSQSGAA